MKKIILVVLGVLIALLAAVYQRTTGPTYPKKYQLTLGSHEFNFKLLRSHGGTTDCPVIINVPEKSITGSVFYRRYPTNDEYQKVDFNRNGDDLVAQLPNQPPAGKLQYYIELNDGTDEILISKDNPVIVRFKGSVPEYVLIPHILFMFLGMIFANIAGLFALGKIPAYRLNMNIAFILLFLGGMVLGPLVQKFAFNEYWAGVPFGWDLTDNKMLIGFVAWGAATFANYRKDRRAWVYIAAIFILIIFSIPHSIHGSELDYSTGTVIQG